jgi:3-oxoacyl-[acyl-carrier protein] reductase
MGALDGRVALVTGGARGIGAATAARLAADGARIALLDLDEAAAAATAARIAPDAIGVGADVRDGEAVQRAVDTVVERLGGLHILVNNAGVTRDNLLFKLTEDDWDMVMGVHLKGAYLMSKAAQKHFVEQKHGRIVNLSSVSALGNRGQANYAAAKAGVQGFTKTLAIELGKFGVTVNAIAPGFIETDMTAATAARVGVGFEEFKAAAAQTIPVGRVGTPDDVAQVVSFFVDERSSFVSGQVLYLAGGPRV